MYSHHLTSHSGRNQKRTRNADSFFGSHTFESLHALGQYDILRSPKAESIPSLGERPRHALMWVCVCVLPIDKVYIIFALFGSGCTFPPGKRTGNRTFVLG